MNICEDNLLFKKIDAKNVRIQSIIIDGITRANYFLSRNKQILHSLELSAEVTRSPICKAAPQNFNFQHLGKSLGGGKSD